ncbi:peptidase M50B-like-domain-containing protein [Diaporthe sp. PMI_573]|nr:peptidase M50B-like-domain-containing protein [Diaporthaceae sp. PMI_573]
MAPTVISPNALRSLDIPRTPNAAMLLAAKRALSEAGPDALRTAAHGFLLRRASLSVTADAQKITLGVIAAYIVGIAILWNIPYVLWPFKMLVIAFHEFGHAFAAKLTGGKVEAISLDPKEGGKTTFRGGMQAITLPAGYLGSSLIGALLTFCGFNIVASKVASFVVGAAFLLIIWWGRRDWLTLGTVLAAIGLLVGCWFIADAEALRYVILFIGVMSSMYSAWDINDDLIRRKVNSSDASQFADRYGGSSQCWGVLWVIISLIFMVGGILAGIAAFPQTLAEQRQDSDGFIST